MENENLLTELAEKEAQLVRLGHSLEKMKLELGQKEEMVKQKDAELSRRAKEIQRLDEKMHRVDSLTAELLETQEQKKLLEQQLRDRDFELDQINQKLQKAEAERKAAESAERKARHRCDDLKEQVRIEVERSSQLEDRERARDSESAPEARARLQAEADRLAETAKNADRLVAASRRVQRQLANELATAKAEIVRLGEARDAEREAADEAEAREGSLARELAQALAEAESRGQAATGLRSLLAQLKRQFPAVTPWIDEYFQSDNGPGGGRGHGGRLLNGRPSSSAPQVRRPSLTTVGGEETTDGCLSTASRTETSRSDASKSDASIRTAELNSKSSKCTKSSKSAVRPRGGGRAGPSRQLRSHIAALYIHLGDRVTVLLGDGRPAQEATVKYIGQRPSGGFGEGGSGATRSRTMYGLKLLDREAVKSPAASAVEHRYDMLVRARQIDCVFNRKSNSFRQLDGLINDYLQDMSNGQ